MIVLWKKRTLPLGLLFVLSAWTRDSRSAWKRGAPRVIAEDRLIRRERNRRSSWKRGGARGCASCLRCPAWLLLLLTAFLSSGAVSCVPLRYNQQQLLGAEPRRDLLAAKVVGRLSRLSSERLSVKGVRLKDSLSRVRRLWGPPSGQSKNSLFWTDSKGTYWLRVSLYRREGLGKSKKEKKKLYVRQIDIFSAYQPQLHPENRVLLQPARIRSKDWRTRIFGDPGALQEQGLYQLYNYPKRGYRLLLFSRSLPFGQRLRSAFTLFLPGVEGSPRVNLLDMPRFRPQQNTH